MKPPSETAKRERERERARDRVRDKERPGLAKDNKRDEMYGGRRVVKQSSGMRLK